MTAEDLLGLAAAVEKSIGVIRREGVPNPVAVFFDAGEFAKCLREQAQAAISVPLIVTPGGGA